MNLKIFIKRSEIKVPTVCKDSIFDSLARIPRVIEIKHKIKLF